MTIQRVERPRLQAGPAYDRLSRWYGLLATGAERRLVEQGVAALELCPGEQVLEVGPGTGTALQSIAGLVGPDRTVYGIDLSIGMCRVARQLAQKQGLGSRVALINADAMFAPIASDSFDAVFMSFVLELFDTPEIGPVLGQCLRVLRSGGRLATVALSRAGEHGLPLRLYEWGHRRMPDLLDCRPIYLAKAIAEAGFRISYSRMDSMWALPVEIVAAEIDPSGDGGARNGV